MLTIKEENTQASLIKAFFRLLLAANMSSLSFPTGKTKEQIKKFKAVESTKSRSSAVFSSHLTNT